MSEKITINELLKRSTVSFKIDKIPTVSKREPSARKILNEILAEHDEWFPCIAAIVVYPIQQWAKDTRKRIGIDLDSLEAAIEEHGSFFGINSAGRFETQKSALSETNKEIELVKQILSQNLDSNNEKQMMKVINAIHGTDTEDISKYMVLTYYRPAIEMICKKYNHLFVSFADQMAPRIRDEEFASVYHNTDLMVRQLNSISDMNRRWKDEISYQDTYRTMKRCIKALDHYSIDGPLLRSITEKYAEGYPELRIAENLHKSRNYVRRKYQTAIEILSYLLWGYSTREVLRNHIR